MGAPRRCPSRNAGLLGCLLAGAAWIAGSSGRAAPAADGYRSVGFDQLAAFDYLTPDGAVAASRPAVKTDQIPKRVRELNHSRVALKGFMLPITTERGLVTEMLIMRDQSTCCYGAVPKINQWVDVHMKDGKGVKALMDRVITLYGTLKVGEEMENGCLVGIYEMEADKMTGPDE